MAALIPDAELEEVRERSRIEDVVGDYVDLKPGGGGSLKGLCPFHDEKTPSFNVRPSHGTWRCFGSCADGGDVIKFVQQIENVDFRDAVERLAERFGVRLAHVDDPDSVVDQTPEEAAKAKHGSRTAVLAALDAAAAWYHGLLMGAPEADPGRQALAKRAFGKDAAERFRLGWAPTGASGATLVGELTRNGHHMDTLDAAGLVIPYRGGFRDRFRGRLLWPISDPNGRVIGFGARRVLDDDPLEAKYMNTPETVVYKKSRVLYGIETARKAIADTGVAHVVEGYTDVMAAHLAGVPNTIAACGTAFTEDHALLLKRLLGSAPKAVVFAFDNDKAGQAASARSLHLEELLGVPAFAVVTAGGKDPAQLREEHGDAAVADMFTRRIPLWKYVLDPVFTNSDLSSPAGRMAALDAAIGLLGEVKDPVLLREYAKELAARSETHPDDVLARLQGVTPPRRPRERAVDPDRPARDQGVPDPHAPQFAAEREALKALLTAPDRMGLLVGDDMVGVFAHPWHAAIHQAVMDSPFTGGNTAVWVPRLMSNMDGDPALGLLHELAAELPRLTRPPDERVARVFHARLRELAAGRNIMDARTALKNLPVDDPGYADAVAALFRMETERVAWSEKAAEPDLTID